VLNTDILAQLAKAERLARAGKWRRVLKNPARYAQAQWHRKVDYPRTREGMQVKTPTIFGQDMEVILPAGMDIYLLGAKGHDSEIRLTRLLCNVLVEGNTLVDVGAHFGFFSGLAAKLVGSTGTVIACEAAPKTYAVLEKNLADQANTTAHHLAIAAKHGILTFTEFPLAYSEFNTLRPDQFDESDWRFANQPEQVEVPAISLDELIGDGAADFIKIDVEGAEDVVLAGMTRLLNRPLPPLVCIEYLTAARDNTAHLEAIATLEAAGFKAHEISARGELIPSSIAAIDDQLRRLGEDSDNIVFASI
jgi:FkbM family methyltransferase